MSSSMSRRTSSHQYQPDSAPTLSRAASYSGSPRLNSAAPSPRVAESPRFPYSHRKQTSIALHPFSTPRDAQTPQGLWSAFFGSASAPLPYTRRGQHERGMHGPTTRLELLREMAIRPVYVLARRGPILPLLVVLAFLCIFLLSSSSTSTQTVKIKVQGAVGPYIPKRAAQALSWKATHLNGQDPLGSGKYFPASKPPSTTKPSEPRKDGRVLMVEGRPHPIPKLMEDAKAEWDKLKARQSKTFAQAVGEYKRRNGRNPPKGFDKWFAFAKAHKVLLIDEFDLINKDLNMYRAFKPSTLHARVKHLEETFDQIWSIDVKDGKATREGEFAHHDRAIGVVKLMKRFVHLLPDMRIVYNGHDGARIALADEERKRLENLVKIGAYDKDDKPPFEPKERGPAPHHSMEVFCPAGSAVRAPGFIYGWAPDLSREGALTGYDMPPLEPGSAGAFIDNFKTYMDVCESPQYRQFHASTAWVYAHDPTIVAPLFTPGVQLHFGDVHGLITEQLEKESDHDPSWEERPFTSLQWRGQTSGPYWESSMPWKTTHRARLHLLSHQEEGSRNVTITDARDFARTVETPNYRVNPLFLDTGMVGPAVQCKEEDGTCEAMYDAFQGYDKRISFDRASLYKYVLDVDGNSWSGRFRRLMMTNAAVIKTTIFPEFWTDWAIPWLHFIPMQVDYSDMWDIMAFFRGGLNGEGAHDELGKQIADAGKEWVAQCYRWPDLEAYQFRLMLEYARLWNEETSPGSNDFTGDASIEPEWTGDIKFSQ